MLAASGEKAAELAGEIGDGLFGLAPDAELIKTFDKSGGKGKSKYGQFHVCVAETEERAREIVHKQWPISGLTGELSAILPTPRHFEQACEMVTEEMAVKKIVCSSDPADHIKMIHDYVEAGYTHVGIHQIGTDHSRFFDLYRTEVVPEFTRVKAGR